MTSIRTPRARGVATTPVADDQRWAAVAARDSRADGAFVYSVRTTGVYCRPSCPSRRARRENVAFHASPAAARQAGFRACKRCRPDEASRDSIHAAVVAAACRRLDCADEPIPLNDLAAAAAMSSSHFRRVFQAHTGLTPKAYAHARRAERFRCEVARPGATVAAAMQRAGFNSASRLYAQSTQLLGMTPTAYRRGGVGATIQFSVGECSLGSVLVAATTRGVCAIFLGLDPEQLVHELEDRFPRAELRGGDAAFEHIVGRVIALIEDPARAHELPLDIRGTAFQQRVWRALTRIPPGQTITYTELARRIGRPRAVRAVGSACGDNPLAVAIPCHRVVRTDGSLAGYRWGLELKRQLLDREAGRCEIIEKCAMATALIGHAL